MLDRHRPSASHPTRGAAAATAGGGALAPPADSMAGLQRRLSDESGQALVEYSLILLLIALVAVGALTLIGGAVSDFINTLAGQV
jgi:pilus assembly protein Flp/PilA